MRNVLERNRLARYIDSDNNLHDIHDLVKVNELIRLGKKSHYSAQNNRHHRQTSSFNNSFELPPSYTTHIMFSKTALSVVIPPVKAHIPS